GAQGRGPHPLAARLRAEGVPLPDPSTVAATGWTPEERAAGLDAAEVADPARGAEGRVAGRYDLVSLLIGVNDQYRGRDPEAYRPAFRALLARAVAFAGGDPALALVHALTHLASTHCA